MIKIEQIIKKAQSYLPSIDTDRVYRAYEYAKKNHYGQKRISGEDYLIHPLSVTNILMEFEPDEDTIVAALLHDVTEDCDVDSCDLEKLFGQEVADLVSGMEKLSHVQARGEERQIGSLRKMFIAMAKDIRVVLIKLADRLHNMQTLHFMREEKQKRIASETISIYAPIAARLGIYALKGPLEDLSFFYLYPDEYVRIAEQMKKHEPYRTRILKNAKNSLKSVLKREQINGEISGRVKHFYSIYKKLKRKEKTTVDELYDIFALRIVVKDVAECYSVLGFIHQYWTPLSKRFKDYIAVPKPNNYRSLHTTVIGLSGIKGKSVPIEIQIRTRQMQLEAEYGIAAHWSYKEQKKSRSLKAKQEEWVKTLIDVEKSIKDNSDFMKNLELDTFSDRIFVLTPDGDIKDLPQGATPIDFSFAVHTEIGLRTKAAKVNGRIVPLDYELSNGDLVEIITTRSTKPHQNWLNMAKTSLAKNRIRRYFKSQNRDQIVKDGKTLLNKQLVRFNLPELDPHLKQIKEYIGKSIPQREREEVLERIGNGSLSANAVVKRIIKKTQKPPPKLAEAAPENQKPTEQAAGEIIIEGEAGLPVKMANCCKSQAGDKIVGFVTRGGHITIHKENCSTIRYLDPKRLVEAHWQNQEDSRAVTFEVRTNSSRVGLLRDIVGVFADNNISLEKFGYSEKISPIAALISLRALMSDFDLISKITDQLEQIKGVAMVKQVLD